MTNELRKTQETYGADCPVCPDCRITAEKIIKDNPAIDLTRYNNVTVFELPDIEGMKVKIKTNKWEKIEDELIKE